MHLAQIHYFMTVVEERSISNAAESLFVFQSAVSKQILMLEKELGFSLFDRGYRQIHLTDHGRVLYECLRRCSADFENTLDAIRRDGDGERDLLRVGYVEYWDPAELRIPIERHFAAEGAKIRLSLEPYMVSDLADVLRRGNVDMVVSFDSAFGNREGLNIVPLGMLDCGILYAKDRFSKTSGPTREDFAELPFLETDDTSHPYRQELRAIMEKYGFNNRLIACPRFSVMLARISSGQGIFMASNWTYLVSSSRLGFYLLGPDFPFSAAYLQQTANAGKLPLIMGVIDALRR